MNDTHSAAVDDEIFVGLPCYNRPDGLQDTIRCMRAQTHQNWTLLISDNASPDPRVMSICQQAAADDDRIRFHRHAENLGAAGNFHFAASQGDKPFFMWASDDDLWHPEFMTANLELLRRWPRADMAMSSVDILNLDDRRILQCEGFSRFTSSGEQPRDIEFFLNDPEKLGKANLVYGLFRTDSLRAAIDEIWEQAEWYSFGGDVVFLFGFLCRFSMVGHDAFHLHKRQPTRKGRKVRWRHPRSYRVTKSSEFESYVERHRRVAPNPQWADLAETILRRRQSQRFVYSVPFLYHCLPAATGA